MKKSRFMLVALLMMTMLVFTGCGSDDDNNDAIPDNEQSRVERDAEDGAEDLKNDAEDMGEDIKDGAEDAADDVRDAVDGDDGADGNDDRSDNGRNDDKDGHADDDATNRNIQ